MYYFYIDDILLPVAPSKMSLKIKNQNKTVTLIDGTEFNIVKLPGLSEYSFDCLLPNTEYPFAVYENGFKHAEYFISEFENLKVNQKNFKFRVIRSDVNSNLGNTEMDCTLEEYTIKEDAGEGFDYTVSVKLKQYNAKKTTVLSFVQQDDNTAVIEEDTRAVTKETSTQNYTIKSGDTLWAIAKRYYGNGTKWTDIYNDNKDVIESAAKAHKKASSSNGHWIYPGTVIVVKDGLK